MKNVIGRRCMGKIFRPFRACIGFPNWTRGDAPRYDMTPLWGSVNGFNGKIF